MASRPVRVLHVIDGLGGGGAERWIWDIVRRADPRVAVHRVVTFTPDDGSYVFGPRLQGRGAYAPPLRARHPAAARRWRQLGALMLEASPPAVKRLMAETAVHRRDARGCAAAAWAYARFRPDVIHGHLFHGLRVGAWLKRLTGTPFVYSIWALFVSLEQSGAAWVADDYRRLHPVVDAFVTAPAGRDDAERFGVPRDKVDTFVGHIDLDAVGAVRAHAPRLRDDVRRELRVPADATIALSVGRLHPAKGHVYALRALPRIIGHVPTLHWVVLGAGPERDSLEREILDLGLADRVRLTGHVDDVHRYYAAADLYLRTHVAEGENGASHDAMGFGLPVAGFDTACDSDLVASVGHGTLVPNRDADALADAAILLLASPDRGRGVGARGMAYAERHLGIDATLDLFTRTYTNLWQRRHS